MKTLNSYITEKQSFLSKKHVTDDYEKIAKEGERLDKRKNRSKKAKKWELSEVDLDELEDLILDDEDFKNAYHDDGSFENFEESVDYFVHDFLEHTVYVDGGAEVHRFYMLDGVDPRCSYVRLKSGKYVNLDNVYNEYTNYLE